MHSILEYKLIIHKETRRKNLFSLYNEDKAKQKLELSCVFFLFTNQLFGVLNTNTTFKESITNDV